MGSQSLRRAAWAGLQDSMPRAALLSLHARVDGVEPSTWEHPSLAQLWGPRYSTYVVREARLRAVLAREASGQRQGPAAGRAHGRVVARRPRRRAKDGPRGWAGARHWQRAQVCRDDWDGRHPLGGRTRADRVDGRRCGHRPGRRLPRARSTLPPHLRTGDGSRVRPLGGDLPTVGDRRIRVPRGSAATGSIAARRRVAARRGRACRFAPARRSPRPRACCPAAMPTSCSTEPSGSFSLPREDQRQRLWTPRVWPGAVLVEGEIRGTWRRAQHTVRIDAWARLSRRARDAIEAEANSLPLPVDRPIEVAWNT